MPSFALNDPRHPHNRIRLMWHAWKKAGLLGQEIPMGKARTMVKLATGVQGNASIQAYLDDLEGFGVVEWEREKYLRPLPEGLSILNA